ncbi:MAG TPA: hypothetical protein VFJ97_03195 [Dermatophilaceae bacterium]|nr:hypothetical protein [Dermatophilaceae bacterium]
MKRSPLATLQRTARRGLTWRPKWLGSEELSIEALISPLRYDVSVRADFFRFLQAHADLSRPQLLEAARQQPYRVWFQHVAMRRFRPWTLRDANVLEGQFDERVLRSVQMARSFRDRGFDARRPITLRYVRGEAVTDSGVRVTSRLHVGDGGHRLALLLCDGGTLAPGQFRVDPRAMPAVIDNTAILAPVLNLSEGTYARFVSAGYSDERFDTVADLLNHLAEHDPNRVSELELILRAHGRKVALPGS